MTTYTEVFGSATVPAADAKFASFSLTTDTTFYWRYNSSNTSYQVADIMEVTTTAGLSLTFPAANQVSVGESSIVRNVGSNTFTIKDASGGTIGTVAPGVAKLFYLNNNSTVAGTWSVLTFGTGTSSADATTLQGLGLLAIGATLNENNPVVLTATAYTVTTANRGNTLVFTSGSVTCTLPTLATAGDGFTLRIKNNGSGTVTLTPNGVETIDQATLVPGESLMLVAGATGWVTVGYGRTSSFSFTRLNKSVAAGNTSLSGAEAASKIINFYGMPAADLDVTFPAIASVYFVTSELTTKTITLKTGTGTTVALAPGDSNVVICDGVNFLYSVSATYTNNLSLPSGSVGTPPLHFAASSSTGIFSPAPGILSWCANGAERWRMDISSGATDTTTSNNLNVGYDPVSGVYIGATLYVAGTVYAKRADGTGINLDVSNASYNYIGFDTGKIAKFTYTNGSFTADLASGDQYFINGAVTALHIKSGGHVQFAKGISDTGYLVSTQITGFSLTIPVDTCHVQITPAGTIATGTITMPAAPKDGQEVIIASTQIITALTHSPNAGQTLLGALTTIGANGFGRWRYSLGVTTWYRVG